MIRGLLRWYFYYKVWRAFNSAAWDIERPLNVWKDRYRMYFKIRLKYRKHKIIATDYFFWSTFFFAIGCFVFAFMWLFTISIYFFWPEFSDCLFDFDTGFDESKFIDGNQEALDKNDEEIFTVEFHVKMYDDFRTTIEAVFGVLYDLREINYEQWIAKEREWANSNWLYKYITRKSHQFSDTLTRDVLHGTKTWKQWLWIYTKTFFSDIWRGYCDVINYLILDHIKNLLNFIKAFFK